MAPPPDGQSQSANNNPLGLSESFLVSYQDFSNYPLNLKHAYPTIYRGTLQAYQQRIQDSNYFAEDGRTVDVRVLDLGAQGFKRRNVDNDEKLQCCIGDVSSAAGLIVTKQDPTCRFIFIMANTTKAPLNITKNMFCRVVSYYEIMPSYTDFLFSFGARGYSRNVRFSDFREHFPANMKWSASGLGRSDSHFQICYNIKTIAHTSVNPYSERSAKDRQWQIRQTVLYHKYDIGKDKALCIITSSNQDNGYRINNTTRHGDLLGEKDSSSKDGAPIFNYSLALQTLFWEWSTEEWRTYLQWFDDMTREEEMDTDSGITSSTFKTYDYGPSDLHTVQYLQERITEAIAVLGGNLDVNLSLKAFYTRLGPAADFFNRTHEGHQENISLFLHNMDNLIRGWKVQITSAQFMSRVLADRKDLILQRLNLQAAKRQELATKRQEALAALSSKEAIAMRIITIVTLIYLPATFVSTFFSTDIVKYQNSNNLHSESFSSTALVRWLEVILPLTVLILTLGYTGYKIEKKRKLELQQKQIDDIVNPGVLVSKQNTGYCEKVRLLN